MSSPIRIIQKLIIGCAAFFIVSAQAATYDKNDIEMLDFMHRASPKASEKDLLQVMSVFQADEDTKDPEVAKFLRLFGNRRKYCERNGGKYMHFMDQTYCAFSMIPPQEKTSSKSSDGSNDLELIAEAFKIANVGFNYTTVLPPSTDNPTILRRLRQRIGCWLSGGSWSVGTNGDERVYCNWIVSASSL